MADKKDNLESRSPVVAVVGHVDHGKTALLDYIRKTEVVRGEAGSITQSIGAYEAEHAAKKITFIDTPGHEAFTKMRAHGTSAADMAILVVAADEGVRQQTKESLEILRAAETPFVVAITKTDKDGANIEKVKNDLMGEEVFLEGAGGDVSWQAISSKSGEGINELLDLILLMGEVAELKYDPKKEAAGFVIESQVDPRRGIVAHLVVKDGVLKQGSDIRTLSAAGKVKILENFLGEPVKELKPSAPASVVGMEDLPECGEEFVTGDTELDVEVVRQKITPAERDTSDTETIKVVLKADTNGSLEALKELLKEEVEVVESSVGDIMDNDIKFARSAEAIIVGFMVKAKKSVVNLAEIQGVKIFTSKIIYELLDAVKELKTKEKQEFEGGELEVLAVFGATPSKRTVGGKVLKGAMKVNAPLEIERGSEIVGKGRIRSLQCEKEGMDEVPVDKECGLVIETTTEIEKGDLLKIST